jgi:hypothetical protein
MKNQMKNYEQEKKTGNENQIVIVDDHLTAETDELDPLFEKDEDSPAEEIEDMDDYLLEEDSSFTSNDAEQSPEEDETKR